VPERAAPEAHKAFAAGLTGHTADVSVLLLGLLLPFVLLLLMLAMERVERPLRQASVSDELEAFLDTARPEEVETFVSEGFAPALERYWRRRRLSRLRPGRARQ
jgi:hypothetical protein